MPSKVFYDMHLHSCLSPCGDDEMTPCNIAGMSSLKGLGIVALTDHNTCGNCPAFFSACSDFSIVPIAGAEVTTAEDIHVVTLFETLEGAMDFGSFMDSHRVLFPNDPSVFGRQLYTDASDKIVGEEPYLLINALDISIDNINGMAKEYGGIAFPAHIDKMSNSIVSVFGMIPESDFTVYEFADISKRGEFSERFPEIENKFHLTSSDAHYLWDINESVNFIDIFSDLNDAPSVRKELFSILRGDIK
ncbi:MAG: PHP domain-containing protein [Ruminococcaceae bacterium]|nr:PHP domain-containing protein [Oscillospiraceae bacterium]